MLGLQAGGRLDGGFDVVFRCDRCDEVAVGRALLPVLFLRDGQECPSYEKEILHAFVVGKELGKLVDLGDRDAAVEMRPHIMRFGRRTVIDVTANVEVELFLLQFI